MSHKQGTDRGCSSMCVFCEGQQLTCFYGHLSQVLQVVRSKERKVSPLHPCHFMKDDCWHRQLSHAFVLGAGSPVLRPPGSALLCYPGEVQFLLSQVLDLVNDRASSSEFMTL